MPKELGKRKAQNKPDPQVASKPRPPRKKKNDTPKSSAQPIQEAARQNLTLYDWMTVFAYIDTLAKPINQVAIVEHFRSLPTGALIFTQSTLSRKLKMRETLEQRVGSNPNALSSKRPRIVTRPDVDAALAMWVNHMEEKHELVTRSMLLVKRQQFEHEFEVPDEERLTGLGWIRSFCQAYKLKRISTHGEAGSVDPELVEQEKLRIREVLARFPVADRWNVDESGLFPFAPPDHGLAKQQMSGKKANKFHLTLCFACNADGSERKEVFFIGKSKNPRCFGKRGPRERGFYYRNNETAWMTEALFEEWIKRWDTELQAQGRQIALTLDNFSGHNISYEPRCITLIPFKPNLTSFIQPLDAGIIRCFKAHYRREFCLRAVENDRLGERDIYKIDLLEAMLLIKLAWKAVTPVTIKNCWDHTGIQRAPLPPITLRSKPSTGGSTPETLSLGWDIVTRFASEKWTLPEVHHHLMERLGDRYTANDWNGPLDAVLREEDNVEAALASLEALKGKLGIDSPQKYAITEECAELEGNLKELISKLKTRNHIFGTPPDIDELLDPEEERQVGCTFEGGDTEIVAFVQSAYSGAGSDTDSESEDEDNEPKVSLNDMMNMCRVLEHASVGVGGESGLEVSQVMRRYRRELQLLLSKNAVQTTLDNFFTT